jgi:hypothetical protein
MHWNGSDWNVVLNPKTGDYGMLYTVDMVNSSNGWAMGSDGVILHWNGQEWLQVSSPTTNSLESMDMVDANDGWAVGREGTIIRWNGVEWIPESFGNIHLLFLSTVLLLIIAKITSRKRISIGSH